MIKLLVLSSIWCCEQSQQIHSTQFLEAYPNNIIYNSLSYGTISVKKEAIINQKVDQYTPIDFYTKGVINFLRLKLDSTPIFSFHAVGQILCENDCVPGESEINIYESLGYIELTNLINPLSMKIEELNGTYYFLSIGKILLTPVPSTSSTHNQLNFVYNGLFILNSPLLSVEETNKPISSSRRHFITKVIQYLYLNFWSKNEPELTSVERALEILYDSFEDFEHLLIITGNVIYSTRGFYILKDLDDKDPFCPRGIFMISTEQNYAKLAFVSRIDEFYERPKILSNLSERAVRASIEYYKRLVMEKMRLDSDFQTTKESITNLLVVRSVQVEYFDRLNEVERLRKLFFE